MINDINMLIIEKLQELSCNQANTIEELRKQLEQIIIENTELKLRQEVAHATLNILVNLLKKSHHNMASNNKICTPLFNYSQGRKNYLKKSH